jgi:hypothetical protein
MPDKTEKPTTANEVELPSAARVKRIEQLLVADAAVKEKLGKKEVVLKGRDGTPQRFAKEVIEVTQALIDAKKEPFTVLKKDVLTMARKVLKIDESPVAPATEPPAAPETASAPSTKASGKKVVDQTISIVSLLLSAINIAEIGDSHTGADARRKKLMEIKDEYVAAANIKVG